MKNDKTNAAIRAAVESVMQDAAGAIAEADMLAPCAWFDRMGHGCDTCPFYPESREGSDCFRGFVFEILCEAAERTAANLGK